MKSNYPTTQKKAKQQALIYLKAAQKHINKLALLIQNTDNFIEALSESQIVRNYLNKSNRAILKDELINRYSSMNKNNNEDIGKIIKIFSLYQ